MQVHYDEGIANHIGPKPCVGTREGMGEASVGVRVGQPLSREKGLVLSADAVTLVEGNMPVRGIASAQAAQRGLRTWHIRKLLVWEPGDLWSDHPGRYPAVARVGKVRNRSR